MKVSEHLERWLADSVCDTVRPTTYERYEQIVRLHTCPVLGKLKLKGLTPAHVRGLYRDKLDAGLSPRRSNTSTLRFIRRLNKPSWTDSLCEMQPKP